MDLQQKVVIHNAVINYIKITRNDLINERYSKGGYMKMVIYGYQTKCGGYNEEDYWDRY